MFSKMFSTIIPSYFFLSLFIGILFCYLNAPQPTVIVKYPTPYNEVSFKDNVGNCYKYVPEKTQCKNDTINVKVSD